MYGGRRRKDRDLWNKSSYQIIREEKKTMRHLLLKEGKLWRKYKRKRKEVKGRFERI